MAKRTNTCDLRIAKKSKHRTLYKFELDDESSNYILVCADCLTVLVRQEWHKKIQGHVTTIMKKLQGE